MSTIVNVNKLLINLISVQIFYSFAENQRSMRPLEDHPVEFKAKKTKDVSIKEQKHIFYYLATQK